MLYLTAAVEQGRVPLHVAAAKTNLEMMELLLGAGADVQAQSAEVSAHRANINVQVPV